MAKDHIEEHDGPEAAQEQKRGPGRPSVREAKIRKLEEKIAETGSITAEMAIELRELRLQQNMKGNQE